MNKLDSYTLNHLKNWADREFREDGFMIMDLVISYLESLDKEDFDYLLQNKTWWEIYDIIQANSAKHP